MTDAAPLPAAASETLTPERVASRIRRGNRDTALRRLLAAGDSAAVLLALATALALPGRAHIGTRLPWGLVAVPLFITLFKLYGLYDSDVKRISHSTVDDLPRIFHATVIGGLLLWLYSKYSPLHRLFFAEILLFGVLFVALVVTIRFALRTLIPRVFGCERALLVGSGDLAQTLVDKLRAHREYGLEVVGSLVPGGGSRVTDQPQLPILGTLDALEHVASREDVRRVIFASSDVDERELERLLRRCRALSLKVSVLPGLSEVLGPAVEIDDVEGVTVLGVNPPWLPRSSRAVKRAMDIIVASVLLLLSLPMLVLVAIAVRLDSSGGVLFTQERVGRGGRHFRLFKFRTMVTNAEQLRAELLTDSTDPDWLKLDHDPRVTRVGHWLRRLSLDELPQLWNVLRGQMSMVGPRPLIPAEDERVQEWARGRLDLTPGITGYWQVLGRTRIPFEEMIKLDYLYVMNWSLWQDVRLILRTLPVVLAGRGAN